jgi:hypothetical protein
LASAANSSNKTPNHSRPYPERVLPAQHGTEIEFDQRIVKQQAIPLFKIWLYIKIIIVPEFQAHQCWNSLDKLLPLCIVGSGIRIFRGV